MKLVHLPEPPLQFGHSSSYEVFDPVYGLDRFGPFDFTRERAFDAVTVVAVGPKSEKNSFFALWKNLVEGVSRLQYEPKYELGFKGIYRLEQISLLQKHDEYICIDEFNGAIEEKYRSAIQYVKSNMSYDVVVLVESEQSPAYLHDLLKRDCIRLDIPTQYLELETLGLRDRGSVLHNIAAAIYAKSGGIPWRVKHPTITNTCTIGLSFHLAGKGSTSSNHRTIVGVAEVLDEFGRHLTMKASQVDVSQNTISQFRHEFRSLYIPQNLMETIVKGALDSAQWPGRIPPKRLIVHKTTAFHEQEITGLRAALEALEINIQYALIHIKETTVQRAYRKKDKNVVRGLLLTLREDIPEVVLWTVGKVPGRYRERGKYVYFEKSGSRIGTSDPIAIHLNAASRCPAFNTVDAARQVFALSKMRWNTVEMSIRLPVSIYLARKVGTFISDAISLNTPLTFLDNIDAIHFW